jgi:hypothetical protein
VRSLQPGPYFKPNTLLVADGANRPTLSLVLHVCRPAPVCRRECGPNRTPIVRQSANSLRSLQPAHCTSTRAPCRRESAPTYACVGAARACRRTPVCRRESEPTRTLCRMRCNPHAFVSTRPARKPLFRVAGSVRRPTLTFATRGCRPTLTLGTRAYRPTPPLVPLACRHAGLTFASENRPAPVVSQDAVHSTHVRCTTAHITTFALCLRQSAPTCTHVGAVLVPTHTHCHQECEPTRTICGTRFIRPASVVTRPAFQPAPAVFGRVNRPTLLLMPDACRPASAAADSATRPAPIVARGANRLRSLQHLDLHCVSPRGCTDLHSRSFGLRADPLPLPPGVRTDPRPLPDEVPTTAWFLCNAGCISTCNECRRDSVSTYPCFCAACVPTHTRNCT